MIQQRTSAEKFKEFYLMNKKCVILDREKNKRRIFSCGVGTSEPCDASMADEPFVG